MFANTADGRYYSYDWYVFGSYSGVESNTDGKKEGNVSFNDALNTFYFRLYGVRYMVKDHSDSERRNPLQQGFFYMHHPTEGIKHTTSFVRGALAGTRNSSIVPP